jgi:hypothetical protein
MLEELINYTNTLFNIDISTDSRKRNFVDARAFYYELARKITICSLYEIGKPLGKNHATVLHSLNNVTCFLDREKVNRAFKQFEPIIEQSSKSYSYLFYKNKELELRLDKMTTMMNDLGIKLNEDE